MENLLIATQTGGILGPFAWILGKILEVIYNLFATFGIYNIGLCIVIFTLVVRLLMLPSSIKQNKSMKINAYITPEIQAIQKKYENKKDQASQLKMQEEMQAVYDKYGTSATGGCLPLIIQMPILFSLYAVIRNIPAYVKPVKTLYESVIKNLDAKQVDTFFKGIEKAGEKMSQTEINQCIDAMTGYATTKAPIGLEEGVKLADILKVAETGVANKITEINSFFGLNISMSPSEMKAAGVSIIIVLLIPILAGLFQFLSVQLSQKLNKTASTTNSNNSLNSSMKMMNFIMPLFSVWLCYQYSLGIGIYWVAGSLIMMLQQLFINWRYKDIDVEAIIEANKGKAAAKAEKRKAKEGIYRERVLEASKVNTRNFSSSSMTDEEREEKIRKAKEAQRNGNSIAARANMVSEYNKRNEK